MGEPAVQSIDWAQNTSQTEMSEILLAVQKNSEHPLAEPVVRYLENLGVKNSLAVSDIRSITGKGIIATINDSVYFVGNRKLLEENSIRIPDRLNTLEENLRNEAFTVFFFADKTSTHAVIAVSDKIKASSVEAVARLHKMGIEVHMLTGDNRQTAEKIAREANIDSFIAEALPQAKYDFVKKLQEQGKIVAMAGDGINDSQALAQADVSIAMGKGSDIAMDVAKMTIISSDLLKIPAAVRLSRQTTVTIKQYLS